MKLTTRLFAVIAIAMFFARAQASSGPLPLTPEYLDRTVKIVNRRIKELDVAIVGDKLGVIAATYQRAIEGDLKYSFDETFRRAYLLQYESIYIPQLAPVLDAITDNPSAARGRGLISQRTLNILEAQREAGAMLTPAAEKLLRLIYRCQKTNAGTCDATSLMNALEVRGKPATTFLDGYEEPQRSGRLFALKSNMYSEYDGQIIDQGGWIVEANGRKVPVMELLDDRPIKFGLHAKKVTAAQKFAKMADEERKQFGASRR